MPKRNSKGKFVVDKSKPTYNGMGIWLCKSGYPTVWENGKSKKVHVLEWEKHNGPKPSDMHIHHIDEDKSNWDIENLELLTPSDHQRVHAGWIRDKNGDWVKKPCVRCKKVLPLDDFYQRNTLKHNTQSGKCKKCYKEHHKEISTDEYKKKRKKYMKEYYRNNKEKWGVTE